MEQKAQKQPTTELDGTLQRFSFRNLESGFAVARFELDTGSTLPIVGPLAQLLEGQRLRVTGRLEEHARFGPQFVVDHASVSMPSSTAGIRAYLSSSMIKGIGPATADRILEAFGEDSLQVIEEQPERLREVKGLGRKRIKELVAAVHSQRDIQEVMVFLRAHGLGQNLAMRIVKQHGKGAAALIQANPFRLADEVLGIGFRTADRLASELGIAPEAPERIQAGTLFSLGQSARQGHCYVPQPELTQAVARLLELDEGLVEPQIAQLLLAGRVHVQDSGDHPCVYPATLFLAESGTAKRIELLIRETGKKLPIAPEPAVEWFCTKTGMQLPEAQHLAVINALAAPVSVITGGPGVGKTTIIRALAEILRAKELQLLLAAPTGRAAKRLEESTRQAASTVHRLLEYQPGVDRFHRDLGNPLMGHMLVVDEASMLDVRLAYHLLRAVPPGMRLVLVGDVNQLPAVGPGQVLKDIIDSGRVPVTRLTEIFRQQGDSLIVQRAHGLLRGEMPIGEGSDEDADFFFVETKSNQHTAQVIGELVTNRIPRRFGMDSIRDVQVLCPMYRGEAGADKLNANLQDALNPGRAEIKRVGRVFREGDKVMQIRNDYDLELFNGDTGRIVRLPGTTDDSGSSLLLDFGGRRIEYPITDLDALIPAYAITVHRSQGSEYPAVVIPMATDHFMMLRRSLLYTAITRGRNLVVLVGSQRALAMAVDSHEEAGRYSGLAERLSAARISPSEQPE